MQVLVSSLYHHLPLIGPQASYLLIVLGPNSPSANGGEEMPIPESGWEEWKLYEMIHRAKHLVIPLATK